MRFITKLGGSGRLCRAFTLVEVLVSTLLVGTLMVALLGAFSAGLNTVQAARENMRATQIMMQKMEAIRLFTWNQTTNAVLAPPIFQEWYDPSNTTNGTHGTLYHGRIQIGPAPASIPAAYRAQMRSVTVTLAWTNWVGSRPVAQEREMRSLVARHGMQNYVY